MPSLIEQLADEKLQEISDEQFKIVMWAVVELFQKMKAEAIRRNLWEELSKKKLR